MAQSSHAPLPRTLSYQGVLAESGSGIKAAGSRLLTVTLYGDANSTIKLWQSTMNTQVDSNGVFNCLLGTVENPLPDAEAMDRPIWLGVAIDNGPELRPLSQVTASAYALNVADSSITTAKLADRSVTWNKMATDYVPYIRVNGAKINTGQNSINFTGGDGLRVDYDSNSMSLIFHPDSASSNIHTGNGPKPLWIGYTGGNDTDGGGWYNVVAGGLDDTAEPSNYQAGYASVVGGHKNRVRAYYGFIGGGDSNLVTGYADHGVIGGGVGNFVDAYGSTIAGGESNSISTEGTANDQTASFIGGGSHNRIIREIGGGGDGLEEMGRSVIGGGSYNSVYELGGFIGGGDSNIAEQEYSAVVGGLNNIDSNDFGYIGGGARNKLIPADEAFSYSIPGLSDTFLRSASGIVAGVQNLSNGGFNFIGSGWRNSTVGDFSAIPGGFGLTLGSNSFGFNGEYPQNDTVLTDLTALGIFPQVAYFGDVNLMIGNVDSTARAIQFYSPQKNHTYSGAHYSSFQAAVQPQGNIIYTLPDSLPVAGMFLKAASVAAPNVTLKWDTITGSGGGLAGWLLAGNSGTTSGPNYLGTQDNEAFEIHIHNNTHDTTGGNQRVIRYTEGPTSPNILGGSSYDSITPGLSGAAILSGGSKLAPNVVSDTFSVIAGGRGNLIQGPLSVIAGGDSNQITASGADHNFIGGGFGNIEANPSFGVIGGGLDNYMAYDAYSSVISGGEFDTVYSSRSFLGGGHGNVITGQWQAFSVLGGGESNTVQAGHAFTGGGFSNYNWGDYSSVVGGKIDSLASPYGFLGGGENNALWNWHDSASVLVGGASNAITQGSYSFIGGGLNDTIRSPYAVLGGGQGNKIDANSDHSVLTGGDSNMILPYVRYSAILGGAYNKIDSAASLGTVVGGNSNMLAKNAAYSIIAGGSDNLIASSYCTIGAGRFDSILSYNSVIAGGESNFIDSNSLWSVVGGGSENKIQDGGESTISGGEGNRIDGVTGAQTIGGGSGNSILDNTDDGGSIIAGGIGNTIYSGVGTIAGGENNTIDTGGYDATIPGGLSLTANAGAQTVMGEYNQLNAASLLIVGNGSSSMLSNAFEVTFPGASIVHDMDSNHATAGVHGTRWPIYGGRYQDNTPVADGDVSTFGPPKISYLTYLNTVSDFGVRKIYHPHVGQYIICIQNVDTHRNLVSFANGIITATLKDMDTDIIKDSTITLGCGSISVTNLYPFSSMPAPYNADVDWTPANGGPPSAWFIVRTSGNTGCEAMDRPFYFKVCARPW